MYQAGTKLTAGYYNCLLVLFVWLSLPCKAEWSNAPTQVFIFAEVVRAVQNRVTRSPRS